MSFLKTWLKCFAAMVGTIVGVVGVIWAGVTFPLAVPIFTVLGVVTAIAYLAHEENTNER